MVEEKKMGPKRPWAGFHEASKTKRPGVALGEKGSGILHDLGERNPKPNPE